MLISAPAALAQSKDSAEEAEQEVLLLLHYIENDKESGMFSFNEEKAVEDGVPKEMASKLNMNFEGLNLNQQSMLYSVSEGRLHYKLLQL